MIKSESTKRQPEPKPRRQPTKKRVLLFGGYVLLGAVALLWPRIWGGIAEMKPHVIDESFVAAASADRFSHVIVIMRGAEKESATDDTAPYSGSFLTVYERKNGDLFHRLSPIWACRSTTTALLPPAPEDAESIKHAIERDGTYSYGFRSVPTGLFTLKPAPWRSGDTSFLLSEWGTFNGQIFLDKPQELISIDVSEDGEIHEIGTMSHSYDLKVGCYLHPSAVERWDHRGSHEGGKTDSRRRASEAMGLDWRYDLTKPSEQVNTLKTSASNPEFVFWGALICIVLLRHEAPLELLYWGTSYWDMSSPDSRMGVYQ